MKRGRFILMLSTISLFGFLLRLNGYDQTPGWNESLDEIHYAWTGQTWLTTGVPKSWSHLSSYPGFEIVRIWNTDFRLVSPMLEKPPLYSLLTGALVLAFGQAEFYEVKISTIRLLPLFLSIFSILLTGIAGRIVFSPAVGLVSALLYATGPPVVLANRLSVTENLLTPLFLATQLILLSVTSKVNKLQHIVFTNIFPALAILTKQTGVVAGIVILLCYAWQKKWKTLFISVTIVSCAFLIYPLLGYVYDWQLFRNIQTEQRRIGIQGGLPQLVQTIIARPLVTTEKLFPDGVILLGYLLLLTSPWMINIPRGGNSFSYFVFLSIPFAYLTYLALAITGAEPIASGQGYWGWYAFPLFPYSIILVSWVLLNIWRSFSFFKAIILLLTLGSSTIRYILLYFPREVHYRWQLLLIGLFFTSIIVSLGKPFWKKCILFVLFILFICVNVFTSLNLSQVYSGLPQPAP